ncbi:NADH-quinone oxidoreductase subunit N [Candidatus Methylospira mobilis]|uniref:NADH-quinone oxidoreductase subunit N n=1 Tax=Candidatus Methylospira mobilis TaxID=1808979 RepID=A0A5Q0BII6_9GAMM|nr:NADH-quinone oxidoreductase subunit N [Candidatus Methylospira mobilis]QFY41938.1 NADH-quinone oxidoreductase subunit N [Candidatus Methylospira mobilis]
MNMTGLLALLPMIVVAATAVVVMLAIALRRDGRLVFFLTLAGCALALAALPVAFRLAPVTVTGLIRIDAYAIFFSAMILALAAIVALLCREYFIGDRSENEELFVLLSTATLGGMILVSASHFASFFLGLEILSISLFPMIAYQMQNTRALEAGVKYLMLSGVASGLLLFGMALIYSESGAMSFQQLGHWLGDAKASPLVLAGAVMLLAALSFKLSLVPFHLWTADIYEGASAPVTAFVSTVSKTAIFALLLRFWLVTGAWRSAALMEMLIPVAVLSVLAGNLLALRQTRLKRLLAYSSIAHMGYLLIALIAGSMLKTESLVESVGFYLLAYTISNLGAVGVVSALSCAGREAENLDDFAGLFRRDPLLAGILTLNLLSLAGIPLTIGFIGKFYIYAASVHAALWMPVVVVIIGSGMGLYYYLRVVLVMLDQARVSMQIRPADQMPVRFALAGLALLLLWSGIFPEALMEALMSVAQALS